MTLNFEDSAGPTPSPTALGTEKIQEMGMLFAAAFWLCRQCLILFMCLFHFKVVIIEKGKVLIFKCIF